MTGKEGLLKAFTNDGEPDRIPIVPGLDNEECVSLSGSDYWKYEQPGHAMPGDSIGPKVKLENTETIVGPALKYGGF